MGGLDKKREDKTSTGCSVHDESTYGGHLLMDTHFGPVPVVLIFYCLSLFLSSSSILLVVALIP